MRNNKIPLNNDKNRKDKINNNYNEKEINNSPSFSSSSQKTKNMNDKKNIKVRKISESDYNKYYKSPGQSSQASKNEIIKKQKIYIYPKEYDNIIPQENKISINSSSIQSIQSYQQSYDSKSINNNITDSYIFGQLMIIEELERNSKIKALENEKKKLDKSNKDLSKRLSSLKMEKLNQEKKLFYEEKDKILNELREKENHLRNLEDSIQKKYLLKKNEINELKSKLVEEENILNNEKEKIKNDFNLKINNLESDYKSKEKMQEQNNLLHLNKIKNEKLILKQKENEINILNNQCVNIKNNLDIKENQIKNKELELKNKESNINNKYNQLIQMENKYLNNKQNIILDMQNDKNDYNIQLNDLKIKEEQLKNKEYQLIYLEKHLNDKENEIKTKEIDIHNQQNILNDKLNNHNNEINNKQNELNNKINELKNKEKHLDLLQKEIEDKKNKIKELNNEYNTILTNINQQESKIAQLNSSKKKDNNNNINQNEDLKNIQNEVRPSISVKKIQKKPKESSNNKDNQYNYLKGSESGYFEEKSISINNNNPSLDINNNTHNNDINKNSAQKNDNNQNGEKVEEFYVYVDIPDNNINKNSVQNNNNNQNGETVEEYYVYDNNPDNDIKKSSVQNNNNQNDVIEEDYYVLDNNPDNDIKKSSVQNNNNQDDVIEEEYYGVGNDEDERDKKEELYDENNNINNNFSLPKDGNILKKEDHINNDNAILNNQFNNNNNDNFNIDDNNFENFGKQYIENDENEENINMPKNIEDNNLKKQNSNNLNNSQKNELKKSAYQSVDTMNYNSQHDYELDSSDFNDENMNMNMNEINNNSNKINTIKEEENNVEFDIDDIKEELFIEEYNPSLGLDKLENPNYMNAVLQCLAHIPEITEKIINLHVDPDFKNNYQDLKLTREYRELLINMFLPEKVLNLNRRPCNAKNLRDLIIKLNPNFQTEKHIDYKKFFNFVIARLHEELNINKNNKSKTNIDLDDSIKTFESIDLQNDNDVLIVFLNNFKNKNDSIILKNLYGIAKYTLYCHKCQNSFYNYQCYSFLHFNLSKIYNSKISKYSNKDIDLNLFDCFDYYQKPETLLGDKALFCPKCKEYNESTSIKSIYSTRNVLVIIFKNIKEFNKEKINFDYIEIINLRDYVQFKKDEKMKEKFFLCGGVNINEDINGNEIFNAFCRKGKNNDWCCYDNENIYPVTFQEIKNNGFPVILFYHKLNKK